MAWLVEQMAVQPAVRADGVAAHAGFPGVLLFKVGARIAIIADRLQSDGLAALEKWCEWRRFRMQAEEAV